MYSKQNNKKGRVEIFLIDLNETVYLITDFKILK